MSKICLRRLRVIKCAMPHSPPSCSKSETTTLKLPTRSISIFSSFIHNLIKSWKNIVSKLDLRNCGVASYSHSNCKSCNSLLRERCIENSVYPIFLKQSTCTSEDTSKFNIFSESLCTELYSKIRWICCKSYINSRVYRLIQIHMLSRNR